MNTRMEDAKIADYLAQGKIDPAFAMAVADYIGRKGGVDEVTKQIQTPVVVSEIPDKNPGSWDWNSDLWAVRARVYKSVQDAPDLETLRALEVKLLGADGELKNLVRDVKKLALSSDRAEYAKMAQAIFVGVQNLLRNRRSQMEDALIAAELADVDFDPFRLRRKGGTKLEGSYPVKVEFTVECGEVNVGSKGYAEHLFDSFVGYEGAYAEWEALTKREPIEFVPQQYDALDNLFDAAESAKQAGLTVHSYGDPMDRTLGFLVEEPLRSTYHYISLTHLRKAPCERHKDKLKDLRSAEGRAKLFDHGDLVVGFSNDSEPLSGEVGELADVWLAEAQEASKQDVPELALTEFVSEPTSGNEGQDA